MTESETLFCTSEGWTSSRSSFCLSAHNEFSGLRVLLLLFRLVFLRCRSGWSSCCCSGWSFCCYSGWSSLLLLRLILLLLFRLVLLLLFRLVLLFLLLRLISLVLLWLVLLSLIFPRHHLSKSLSESQTSFEAGNLSSPVNSSFIHRDSRPADTSEYPSKDPVLFKPVHPPPVWVSLGATPGVEEMEVVSRCLNWTVVGKSIA